jgi:hypothetical protein
MTLYYANSTPSVIADIWVRVVQDGVANHSLRQIYLDFQPLQPRTEWTGNGVLSKIYYRQRTPSVIADIWVRVVQDGVMNHSLRQIYLDFLSLQPRTDVTGEKCNTTISRYNKQLSRYKVYYTITYRTYSRGRQLQSLVRVCPCITCLYDNSNPKT